MKDDTRTPQDRREEAEKRFEATGRKLRTYLTDHTEVNIEECCELTASDLWREFQDEFMDEERAIDLYDTALALTLERTAVLAAKVIVNAESKNEG